jgi:hypothetical protein
VAPPLDAGAVQLTPTEVVVVPGVTVTAVGTPGTVTGVTEAESDDEGLVPEALVAVTVNVVAVPAVRPLEMVHDVPAVVQLPPAGDEVTT